MQYCPQFFVRFERAFNSIFVGAFERNEYIGSINSQFDNIVL